MSTKSVGISTYSFFERSCSKSITSTYSKCDFRVSILIRPLKALFILCTSFGGVRPPPPPPQRLAPMALIFYSINIFPRNFFRDFCMIVFCGPELFVCWRNFGVDPLFSKLQNRLPENPALFYLSNKNYLITLR